MSTVDPNQRFVDRLEGPGLSLFVTSLVGGIVSLIVVGLRTFIRLRQKNFNLDDGLMLGGLVRNMTESPCNIDYLYTAVFERRHGTHVQH